MKTKGEMQTEGKMQTADYKLFKYRSCFYHYQVLTLNRIIQANRSDSLHSN